MVSIPVQEKTPFPDPTKYYRLVNKKSAKCIDVKNGSTANGAILIQWENVNGDNQQWQFQDEGSGYYRIVSKKSGKFISVTNGSTANQALLHQYEKADDDQKWRLEDAGDGYFHLINKKSGKFISITGGGSTANGAQLHQYQKADEDQKWRFEAVKLSPPDATDVMIKDGPSDTGVEPYRGKDFWNFSDIVVRTTDDGVFLPDNPAQSGKVERGQPNYIYVRVTNKGPQDARNVTVTTRITPAVGLQFVYPQDWTLEDKTHVSPEPITANFASIPAGGTAIAKFRIEAAQTETLYGWTKGTRWHPCLLAMVKADNDYAFTTATLTNDRPSARFNNLAQRNLSVVDEKPGGVPRFAFIAGNQHDAEPRMSIKIDRSGLPKDMPLELALDDDGSAFPLVNFETLPTNDNEQQNDDGGDNGLVFLERTRLKVRLDCGMGVLTVEKGSRFDCLKVNKLGKVTVKGGDLIVRDDKRYVEVKESVVTVEMEKSPNGIYPLSLQTTIPATAKKGEEFFIQVEQQNTEGTTVGGASVVYVPR
jgi:hypothetical protein